MNRAWLVVAVLAVASAGCGDFQKASSEAAKAAEAKAEADRAKAELAKAEAELAKAKAEAELAKLKGETAKVPLTPPAKVPVVKAPPAVDAGKQFVEQYAKEICKFAYAYRHYAYNSHTFDGSSTSDDGYYVLTYTWKIDGSVYTRSMTLELVFTHAGQFDHLAVKRHDAVYEPFDLAKSDLDEKKNQIKAFPAIKDNAGLKREVDDAANGKKLCEFYLKQMQR